MTPTEEDERALDALLAEFKAKGTKFMAEERAKYAQTAEFPAFERVAQVVGQLDGHRQRQVCAFLAARYGWNVKPTAKKIGRAPNPENRSEFAAIETACEELDQLTAEQQRQAVALLAARFGLEVTADYKAPSGGFSRKRSYKRG